MGYSQAAGYAEMVAEGSITLRQGVIAHMQSNMFPVLPEILVDVAVTAIEAMREEQSDILIALPEGMTFLGETHAQASAIIESMRLDAFVDMV